MIGYPPVTLIDANFSVHLLNNVCIRVIRVIRGQMYSEEN